MEKQWGDLENYTGIGVSLKEIFIAFISSLLICLAWYLLLLLLQRFQFLIKWHRSEEHTSELQSQTLISYAVFLKIETFARVIVINTKQYKLKAKK